MKNITCTVTVIFIICFMYKLSFSQTPNWDWAKSATGTYRDEASSVVTDNLGNTYLTGYFLSSTITFESITLTNASPGGSWDFFLAKYDSNGNILWAKSVGGLGFDVAHSLAIDSSGFIYVTGYFGSATLEFDSITITNKGWNDIFIAKYDSNGNAIWANSAGGIKNDIANSVTVDNSGNIYLTGKYRSLVIYFDSDSLINTNNYEEIFLAKYDSDGILIWAKSAGGTSNDEASSVALDINGNIYLAGMFKSTSIYFDSDSLTNTNNKSDFFLVKYNSNGILVWAKGGGGFDHDTATSVVVDIDGNIYLGGSFKSPIIFFNNDSLINAINEPYSTDIFLIKYNETGETIWSKRAGEYYDENITSLVLDNAENIILSGNFESDQIIFNSDTLHNMGYNDIFILNLDKNGNTNWVKGVGDTGSEYAHSVFADQYDNAYLSGYFTSSTLNFDSSVVFNNVGSSLFVAKLFVGTIGISDLEKNSLINIFPNPSSDFITVNIPLNSDIEIVNINGQVIRKFKNSQSQTKIDISSLTNGIYFIKVKVNSETIIRKIIKQ